MVRAPVLYTGGCRFESYFPYQSIGIVMHRPTLTAIIYDKKGNILSIGKNSYVKTHPLQSYYANKANDTHKKYLHAEIAAIVRLGYAARPYRIVVHRYGSNGEPRLAKPCAICIGAIKDYGIKRIEHT
jgi:tRNA(Arg) A34 adenosine deaminase TadA